MSLRVLLVITALAATGAATGCGPAPGIDPRVPSGAIRVVPAEQVKGSCACEDDELTSDDAVSPSAPVEYVKLTDWQPPPQVAAVEASVAPRGNEPPRYTAYPELTRHAPIGATSFRRSGRRFR